MKIPVKCKCGKVLSVPPQYAGKRGRCPQCARLLIVPEARSEPVEEKPPTVCPTCGAYMGSDDDICVSCKMNVKTGQWDMAEVEAPKTSSFSCHKLGKILLLMYFVGSFTAVLYFAFLLFENAQKQGKEAKQKEQAESEMVQFLEAQKAEISQLLKEGRNEEVMMRITPRLLRFLATRSASTSSSSQEAWDSLIRFYENFSCENHKNHVSRHYAPEDRLKKYTSQFEQYLPLFQKGMQQRNYEEVQKNLEILWQAIHAQEDIDPEAPLIITLREKLKEVQSIKTLFSISHEGAKSSLGLTKAFFTKDRQVVLGSLKQYSLGTFSIQTEEGKTIQLPLKNLSCEEIVFFALHAQKSKYVYQYAGIFYLYEKAYNLAQESFRESLKYGAEPEEIKKYIKITQQSAVQEK